MKSYCHNGYTLIELLVSLVVSGIVIAGTYAGYTFFAQQTEYLSRQTEINRNTLRAINQIQFDIRQAGFVSNSSSLGSIDPLSTIQCENYDTVSGIFTRDKNCLNNNAIFLIYDDDSINQRILVRYYLRSYTPSGGSTARYRIIRDVRVCNDKNCLSNSPAYGGGDQVIISGENLTSTAGNMQVGEPILDWINAFIINGKNIKKTGTFIGQYQTIEINIKIGNANRVVQGTNKSIIKNFTFLTRAKNVSLIP